MSRKGDLGVNPPQQKENNIDALLIELGKQPTALKEIGRDTMFKQVNAFENYNISTDSPAKFPTFEPLSENARNVGNYREQMLSCSICNGEFNNALQKQIGICGSCLKPVK